MKLRKKSRVPTCRINMAPLIDIVFLLIIFFMTVTQMTKMQVENLRLPEAKSGEAATAALSSRLVVNIRESGEILVVGRIHTLATLDAMLADAVRQRGAADVSVLLRGDRDMSWRKAGAVMKLCAARGIDRVRVAVQQKDER